MPSVYLKCDICGAEYDGEEYGPTGERRMTGIRSGLRRELEAEARRLGWTGLLDYDWRHPITEDRRSFCPNCSKQKATLSQPR